MLQNFPPEKKGEHVKYQVQIYTQKGKKTFQTSVKKTKLTKWDHKDPKDLRVCCHHQVAISQTKNDISSRIHQERVQKMNISSSGKMTKKLSPSDLVAC